MNMNKDHHPRKIAVPSKLASFFKIAGATLGIVFLLWAIGAGGRDSSWLGSGGERWLFFGCMVSPVIGAILFFGYKITTWITEWKWASSLDREGCIINGEVHSFREEEYTTKSGSKAIEYFVTYRYQVNGQPIQLEEKITGKLFDQLDYGSSVKVCYLPRKPDVARLSQ